MSLAHFQGSIDAAATFGLEKTAIDWAHWGNVGKKIMIGEPQKYWQQLQGGKLFRQGGMMHNILFPEKWWEKGLMYGLPILGVGSSFLAPKGHRGSAIGEAIGGTIGGTLGMPLGIVGSSIGASLAGGFGKSLGSAFDAKAPSRAPELLMPNGRPPVQRMFRPLSNEVSNMAERPEFAF